MDATIKTTRQQLVEYAKKDLPFVITTSHLEQAVDKIISLLTPTQRKNLLRKTKICDFYNDADEKGMPESRKRSIIGRKFNVKRQNMTKTCQPCTSFSK